MVNIGSDIAGTSYDAATANWGVPWRMPSLAQWQELHDKCTYVWTSKNGVSGWKFTGLNGGTIFLPPTGSRVNSEQDTLGWSGFYWSSTLCDIYPVSFYEDGAWGLYFSWERVNLTTYGHRYHGHSVRPVR